MDFWLFCHIQTPLLRTPFLWTQFLPDQNQLFHLLLALSRMKHEYLFSMLGSVKFPKFQVWKVSSFNLLRPHPRTNICCLFNTFYYPIDISQQVVIIQCRYALASQDGSLFWADTKTGLFDLFEPFELFDTSK